MRSFERRWVRVVLGSFAAEGSSELAPRAGEVDYLGTFLGMRASARPVARIGLRLALWLVALSPLWYGRRWCTFAGLSLDERQGLLGRLLEHPALAVRESAFMMKLAACLALFASDSLRARSGYDPVAQVVQLRPPSARTS